MTTPVAGDPEMEMLLAGVPPVSLGGILEEFERELIRAAKLHPHSLRLPDGAPTSGHKTYETIARNSCERAHREGRLTHADVFEEEAAEVLAAETVAERRRELVQVAAMCLKQIWDIDTRKAAP